jgi:hypothetical protein
LGGGGCCSGVNFTPNWNSRASVAVALMRPNALDAMFSCGAEVDGVERIEHVDTQFEVHPAPRDVRPTRRLNDRSTHRSDGPDRIARRRPELAWRSLLNAAVLNQRRTAVGRGQTDR